MNRCVITGASGLIGSNLLASLGENWEVHALSRRNPNGESASGTRWYQADLTHPDTWSRLPSSIDVMIYLAQSEHFREFPDRALDIFRVNTLSVVEAVEYARKAGARRFVFASSGGLNGSGPRGTSETPPIPAPEKLGYYLSTKLCSEIVLNNYSGFMDVIVLRMFFVYGPGQGRSMLIPRLIENVRSGRPITLEGHTGILLNPTHVSDAVRAITQSLSVAGSQTIDIGGAEILSLREIADVIGRSIGHAPVFSVEDGPESRRIVGDITRMCELLGPPEVRFQDGIRSMV